MRTTGRASRARNHPIHRDRASSSRPGGDGCRVNEVAISYTSSLLFRLREIDQHPGNDEPHNVLPGKGECSLRGNLLAWEHCLVERKKGKVGLAHLKDQR